MNLCKYGTISSQLLLNTLVWGLLKLAPQCWTLIALNNKAWC